VFAVLTIFFYSTLYTFNYLEVRPCTGWGLPPHTVADMGE